jgi:hypothetical protein
MKKLTNGSWAAQGRSLAFYFLLSTVFFAACSKKPDIIPVPVPVVVPPVVTATGTIASFSVKDTLVPFNTGTLVSWTVDNANTKTVATLNNNTVSLPTGTLNATALKVNTTFTLALNSGVSESKTLKVADSLTTLLCEMQR